jgi:hypothetical protein
VSNFFLYADGDAAAEVFQNDVVQTLQRPEAPALADVPTSQGWHRYTTGEGATGGNVAAYVTDAGDAVVYWSQDDVGAIGVVTIPGGGTDGITTLWEWWNTATNSDFIAQ